MKKKNGIHPIITVVAVLLVVAILLYALFGGNRKRDIIGTWVTDTAGIETGFQCGNHGIAATINNATYQYNRWELRRHSLILKGKEFRDRRVYDFSDTLLVKHLSSKQLVVEQQGRTTEYHKIR
ncbi:MAG: hypothetical protein J6031_07790 [Bacteroidales bacterium]|nr:hypothetical protein [Bacteroidales bacterium]